jgi:hypothetical protein
MQINGGRIKTTVHTQGPAFLLRVNQALAQLIGHGLFQFFVAILCALHEQFNLFFDVHLVPPVRQIANLSYTQNKNAPAMVGAFGTHHRRAYVWV